MSQLCPSCGKPSRLRGRIPDAIEFAGRQLSQPLPGGDLFVCSGCGLNFRWPRLSQADLDALYEAGDQQMWHCSDPRQRRDWALLGQQLERSGTDCSILDVGCFDGGFLNFVGAKWQRYGIEIHPQARERAERSGIRLLGRNFAQLGDIDLQFGAVVALDVIEHVFDPMVMLRDLARLVLPGGIMAIGTGDPSSRAWSLEGSRYWYCHAPEHISFITPQWCGNAAAAVELELHHVHRFCHATKNDLATRMRQLLLNGIYIAAPAVLRWARRCGFGQLATDCHPSLADAPPSWITATDHFVAIFRKQKAFH